MESASREAGRRSGLALRGRGASFAGAGSLLALRLVEEFLGDRPTRPQLAARMVLSVRRIGSIGSVPPKMPPCSPARPSTLDQWLDRESQSPSMARGTRAGWCETRAGRPSRASPSMPASGRAPVMRERNSREWWRRESLSFFLGARDEAIQLSSAGREAGLLRCARKTRSSGRRPSRAASCERRRD
jgi:hypothetical protein